MTNEAPRVVEFPTGGLRSARLLLRPFDDRDAQLLHARRNDPAVAEYQNWTLPFTRAQADEMVGSVQAMAGPTADDWWMLTIEGIDDGAVHGDLAIGMSWGCRTVEVGYTLAPASWGHGYAVEAVEELLRWMFDDVGVTRAFGMLHPANIASAQVLERVGMRFEGHTALSFWVGDDNSDDWIYGMTRATWDEWRRRPRDAPGVVRLVELTPDNHRQVAALEVHRSQRRFVSSVEKSYGDALFPDIVDGAPVVPWLRAVEADGDLVGFVMVAVSSPHHTEPYLWRLLIDRRHQRRGIGRRVIDLVVEECRERGDRSLLVSYTTGRGSPQPLYDRYGFVPTGHVHDDGEIEARLAIS